MEMKRRGSVLLATGLLGGALALAACGGPAPAPRASSGRASAPEPVPSPTTATSSPASAAPPTPAPSESPTTSLPNACLAQAQQLSTQQLAAQVLMVGVSPAGDRASMSTLGLLSQGVGGVFYTSGANPSVATAQQTSQQLQSKSPIPLLVAVDQEGGQVQGLRSLGFSTIPSAVAQSQEDHATLTADWATWAAELKSAGVNVDLAPVADVTPVGTGSNPPIADIDRGYGATGDAVGGHVAAVLAGMQRGGVSGTLKHFPGLGRVHTNTDFGQATDTVTTLDDANTQSFYANLPAAGMVMLSSATYTQIDPSTIGAFSPAMSQALRAHGFDGVIVSDDLGAAAAVARLAPGDRAVRFLDAGGDLVLSVSGDAAAEMASALQAKADADPAFRQTLQDRASRILAYKAQLGLRTCSAGR